MRLLNATYEPDKKRAIGTISVRTITESKTKIFSALIVLAFFACTSILLIQSFDQMFPTFVYFAVVGIFVVSVLVSILAGSELLSFLGVFLFSFGTRLMYYVFTRFMVFPFGDPYGNYGVLREFSLLSKVTVIQTFTAGSSAFYGEANPMSSYLFQYSQWPGLEILTIYFSKATGLGLFQSAMAITMLLYFTWFFVSFVLVKKIMSALKIPLNGRMKNMPALVMAVAVSLPKTWMPMYYKYDLVSTIFLLALILLLVQSNAKITAQNGTLFILFILGLVITHGETTGYWLIFLILVLTAALLYRTFSQSELSWDKLVDLTNSKQLILLSRRVLIVSAIIAISWWSYYAVLALITASNSSSSILRSFSLSSLSTSRLGGGAATLLPSLTPKWILEMLSLRDDLILALLGIGVAILVFRPRNWSRLDVLTVLLASSILTAVTELDASLNYNDRAFTEFAPLLSAIMFLPLFAVLARRVKVGKILSLIVVGFFMFSIAVGFWGSSYAPVYLYNGKVSALTFGEHPLNYGSGKSFMSYSTVPNCILTNEIYVTSLTMPMPDYNDTSTVGRIAQTSVPRGCIVIVYYYLYSFNNSYVGEPRTPPAKFNYTTYSTLLNFGTAKIFSGNNLTIYYSG
jgi:hypothetical protein